MSYKPLVIFLPLPDHDSVMGQKIDKWGIYWFTIFFIYSPKICVPICQALYYLHFVVLSVSKADTGLCYHRVYNLVRERDKSLPQ